MAVADAIDQRISPLRDHEDIKQLPVGINKVEANKVVLECKALSDDTAKLLCPLSFGEVRSRCEALSVRAEVCLRKVQRLFIVVRDVETKAAAKEAQEKKARTDGRDKFSRFLRAASIPTSISKASADFVQWLKDNEDAQHELSISSTALVTKESFSKPVFVKGGPAVEGENFYRAQARTFYDGNVEKATAMFKVKT